MPRPLLAALVALVVGPPVAAADPPKVDVRTLAVSPAVAPFPVLKYELLPRLRDRTPGNAAVDYARAFLLRPVASTDPKDAAARQEKVGGWLDAPPDRFPVADVKKYLDTWESALKSMDTAARLDRYEGATFRHVRADGINTLLPDAQTHRELARVLQLRARVETAEGRFDDAARTLQTMIRAGKDVGESPTLIQMLIGVACEALALGEVERWAGTPGSPNLYWALTALPRPLIDPRPGLEGEAVFFDTLFPNVRELEKGPVSPARGFELLGTMFQEAGRVATVYKPDGLERLVTAVGLPVYVAANYPGAKRDLIAQGVPAAEADRMAPAQVVGLRSVRLVRGLYDDEVKCFSLPYPLARAEFARLNGHVPKARADHPADPLFAAATLILPAVDKVHEAHGRLERRVAGLRAVEAIRLHLAANGGAVPKALADVTVVPVPDDPVTGKPFEYAATADGFTLTGPPPAGKPADARNSVRYDVTVRK